MLAINFEETELRLGLPGGPMGTNKNEEQMSMKKNGKRGFVESESNETNVDLKLNLSSTMSTIKDSNTNKLLLVASSTNVADLKLKDKVISPNPSKPPAKAQVVGWPPVRSFRKNIVNVQKKSTEEEEDDHKSGTTATAAAFIKVSMDGAPYLRKVDLKLYKSYQDLSAALATMFSSFTIGNCGSQGVKELMNESKLIDLLNGSEYVATYEDKDGDWMLVGDVPWPMFVESCKRLRIMNGSEAIGLAPRAVEKCKSRS